MRSAQTNLQTDIIRIVRDTKHGITLAEIQDQLDVKYKHMPMHMFELYLCYNIVCLIYNNRIIWDQTQDKYYYIFKRQS